MRHFVSFSTDEILEYRCDEPQTVEETCVKKWSLIMIVHFDTVLLYIYVYFCWYMLWLMLAGSRIFQGCWGMMSLVERCWGMMSLVEGWWGLCCWEIFCLTCLSDAEKLFIRGLSWVMFRVYFEWCWEFAEGCWMMWVECCWGMMSVLERCLNDV